MISRTRNIAGLAIGVVAALWWVIAMTLQRAAEPFTHVESSTYWLRDVRWLALTAMAVALVWTFQGDRFMTGIAAAGLVAGFGLDILVDRLDFVAAHAAVLLLLGGWYSGFKRDIRPRPRLSMVVACLGGSAAVMTSMVVPVTSGAWFFVASVAVLFALLGVAALGCAFDAGGDSMGNRVLGGMTLVFTAMFTAAIQITPHNASQFLGFVALGAIMSFGMSLVALRDAVNPIVRGAVSLLSVVIAGAATAGSMVGSFIVQPASPFTSWAGNPAMTGKDYDASMALIALVVGLVVGGVLVAASALTIARRPPTVVPRQVVGIGAASGLSSPDGLSSSVSTK